MVITSTAYAFKRLLCTRVPAINNKNNIFWNDPDDFVRKLTGKNEPSTSAATAGAPFGSSRTSALWICTRYYYALPVIMSYYHYTYCIINSTRFRSAPAVSSSLHKTYSFGNHRINRVSIRFIIFHYPTDRIPEQIFIAI